MKVKMAKRISIIAAVVLLAGSVVAFAHGGYGAGMGRGGYMGNGMGPGMMGCGMGQDMGHGRHMMHDGFGYGRGLSEEQATQLENARESFFKETRGLRDQMTDKRIALSRELDKENPDSTKAAQLQNELSQLEGNFAQKRLQHQLEINKILPESVKARGYHHGTGYGARW